MGAENFAVVLVGEPDDLADVLPSWERYLRAANLSPRTVQSYLEAADQLLCHVGPVSAECLSRQHIGSYIEDVLAKHSAATAAVRYRSLQQLCRWLTDEGEVPADPMAGMRPPRVPEQPVPVLTEAELQRLLKSTGGRGFVPRRDAALLLTFLDTGARLSEVAGLRMTDVDADDHRNLPRGDH